METFRLERHHGPIHFHIFVFETGSCYIAQAGLELMILLPQFPQCWDHRHVLPHPLIFPFLMNFLARISKMVEEQ
jgi:hypothetical protein